MEVVVGQNYVLGKKIGKGAFGEIYEGKNKLDNSPVAIKLEKTNAKCLQLLYEARVLKLIQGRGIPKMHWHGTCGEYNVMVFELLGPNLEDLLNFCNRTFSLFTTVSVAEQMLERVEHLHSKGFLHRDIKPDNFVIGRIAPETIYMIDFGLAKRYKDPRTKQHIPYRDNKNLTGTARYTSVNTHLGLEQSRRDDIEALAYVYVYFLKGILPWQGLRAYSKKEKYDQIMEVKMSTPPELLCRGLPREFTTFLYYARSLQFESKPDYEYLKRLIRQAGSDILLYNTGLYDWVQLSKKASLAAPNNGDSKRREEGKGDADEKLKFPEKDLLSYSEDMLVPTERDRTNMTTIIPQCTYIENEQHYRKHKHRMYHRKKEMSRKGSDEISINSFTTYKAMPELKDPKQFRWKNNLCKSTLNFDYSK